MKFYNAPHFRDFWEKGNGKELINWAGVQPDISRFEKYAHLYHQVDDLADAVVKNTYLKMPYPEASAIIKKFSENKISERDAAPDSVKKFFIELQEIPNWFNEDLANIGARLCMRSGTNALIILRDFTLMGGYDFAYLGKPLVFTGALKKGAVKRLKDTLEFWVNVTREDALRTNFEAYQLIIRTRFMHSYARLSIKEKSQNWDYQNWGEPVNHWDMIATYTGFSLVFMQGLKKLGMEISEKEELSVYHLWKYIGAMLGIPPEFLPENTKQAVEQLYLWSTLQAPADRDSALLAKGLLDENLTNTIYKFQFQRKLLLSLHKAMNHFLLDKEINERLEIPQSNFTNIFPKLIIFSNKISQKIYPPNNSKKFQKSIKLGDSQQRQVLLDYIKHPPKGTY